MNYFIVTYEAIIDDQPSKFGIVACQSPTTNYRDSRIDVILESRFRILYSDAKEIHVLLKRGKPATEEEYNQVTIDSSAQFNGIAK